MAKDQNLPLNPTKISGCCGRLMCCLKYEHEVYVSFRKRAPKRGADRSVTPAGEGKVIELLAPVDSVTVDLGEGRSMTFKLAELGSAGGGSDQMSAVTHVVLNVPSIFCNHCKMAIEGAVGRLAGSQSCRWTSRTRASTSTSTPRQRSREDRAAIADEGYEVAGEHAFV